MRIEAAVTLDSIATDGFALYTTDQDAHVIHVLQVTRADGPHTQVDTRGGAPRHHLLLATIEVLDRGARCTLRIVFL